jgi:hypothetical protein
MDDGALGFIGISCVGIGPGARNNSPKMHEPISGLLAGACVWDCNRSWTIKKGKSHDKVLGLRLEKVSPPQARKWWVFRF